jgi:hypothetical protein
MFAEIATVNYNYIRKEYMDFFGHNTEYWLELERQAKLENKCNLIEEIATLRSKVSFYESRIQQLTDFMKLNLEVKQGR